MAAMWAVLAVLGGAVGFLAGFFSWGVGAAFVCAFVGAWMLTGVAVGAMLLRGTSAAQADEDERLPDLDMSAMTDQMVGALRSALDAAERMDGAAAARAAEDGRRRACA